MREEEESKQFHIIHTSTSTFFQSHDFMATTVTTMATRQWRCCFCFFFRKGSQLYHQRDTAIGVFYLSCLFLHSTICIIPTASIRCEVLDATHTNMTCQQTKRKNVEGITCARHGAQLGCPQLNHADTMKILFSFFFLFI